MNYKYISNRIKVKGNQMKYQAKLQKKIRLNNKMLIIIKILKI